MQSNVESPEKNYLQVVKNKDQSSLIANFTGKFNKKLTGKSLIAELQTQRPVD